MTKIPNNIRIIPVNSSAISYVGYDAVKHRIVVQWKKGGSWWAYPASFKDYCAMIHSKSIGFFVNEFLVKRKGAEKL